METYLNLEVIFCKDEAAWEAWLAKNVDRYEGVWLKIARKSAGIPSVTHEEALDGALCYGWIDGQGKPYDDKTYYLQKFTPRRAKSMWSRVNIGRVEDLIATGRMRPSGQAAINAAKADGRWDQAYDSSSMITVPEDFAAALDANPKAKAFFESLNKTSRYSFLWRVVTAKMPKTRQSRIQKLVAMLEAEQKFH